MSDFNLSGMGPLSKVNNKSRHDWHLFWVQNDPEFIEDCQELNKLLEVNDNLTFLSRDKLEDQQATYSKILAKYCISIADFSLLTHRSADDPRLDSPIDSIRHNEDNDEIEVIMKLSPIPKKLEYLKGWDQILEFIKHNDGLGSVSKRIRANEDTQLVYAIFRQRNQSKPTTFTNIFHQYMEGELPNYKIRPKNQFKSPDSLERYYDKYKPDR